MKNKIIILGLLAGVFLTLGSCKEETLPVYSEENNIYFPNQFYTDWDTEIYMINDNGSVVYSPKLNTAKSKEAQDTLNYSTTSGAFVVVPVKLMGFLADYQRDFSWRTLHNGKENVAVEGRDYIVHGSYIGANSRNGGLLVELFTDEMDEDDVYTITFELLPNDNFQTNFKEVSRIENETDDLVSTLQITLRYTPTILKPDAWDRHHHLALGPWSIKKIETLSTHFGFETSIFDVATPDIFTLMSYGLALRIWLEEYEEKNGVPYYEKDGVTPMEVGTFVKNLY